MPHDKVAPATGQKIPQKSPKKVFVTGATGALGSVVTDRFLGAGCDVLASFHGKPGLSKPGLRWLEMDLSNAKSVAGARAEIAQADAWIHCAGGFRWAKADQIADADIDFLIDVNLKSAILLTREILPGMKERGFGRIVFVSSRVTIQPPGTGMGAYAASKAGLNQLVLSLADEVRALDINVNAVLPTVIDTPANRKDMPDADYSAWVTPEQLSEILFSLTQPWGRPIHGALIPVSGRL